MTNACGHDLVSQDGGAAVPQDHRERAGFDRLPRTLSAMLSADQGSLFCIGRVPVIWYEASDGPALPCEV